METANKEMNSIAKEKRFDDLSSSGPVSFEMEKSDSREEENRNNFDRAEKASGLHIKK